MKVIRINRTYPGWKRDRKPILLLGNGFRLTNSTDHGPNLITKTISPAF